VAEWSAEIVVDADLARRLIGAQFPHLDTDSLRLLAEGWDNTVWIADDEWAFRFPRRAIAVPLVERELATLPVVAPLLSAAIPVPVFVGRPADGYPWPFFAARLIPGRELADAALDDAARIRLARPLGAFLRALHESATHDAVAAHYALPVDPNGRADMALRVPRTRERLAEAGRLGLARLPSTVDRLLEAARGLPAPEATAFAHGDLHLRHLLVDEDGALTGVIDWGDVCVADPAIDLQLVWSVLPPEGRAAFLDAYGPVSEEQLLRARVLALFLSAVLAVYGRAEGRANLEREAVQGLVRAATD
jgi:aminoglycoside phosphotransferase (APT) family kinase protein